VRRHIVQTRLLGEEIALWREDSGNVNAWANRCPHRGVRLSIGINTGSELRCRYHGWRFAAGTGQCTFIPAHPNQKPASTMHATLYRAVERHDYVWVSLGGELEPPLLPIRTAAGATTLRSIFVGAPVAAIAARLERGYRIDATTRAPVAMTDDFMLTARAATTVTFLLQPLCASETVIHAIVCPQVPDAERIAVLRHHNAQMTLLRDEVEGAAPPARSLDGARP
jgi:nitrite reductase/ring-hydroxylating ferredoxin subunit